MKDDTASIYPIAIFIVCLGLISLAILIGSEILDPFFNLMADGAMKTFLLIVWPYGLAMFMLIVLIFTLLMEMQKDKYKS
jgi:hypothetical protein